MVAGIISLTVDLSVKILITIQKCIKNVLLLLYKKFSLPDNSFNLMSVKKVIFWLFFVSGYAGYRIIKKLEGAIN
jgi:hypothetical protein